MTKTLNETTTEELIKQWKDSIGLSLSEINYRREIEEILYKRKYFDTMPDEKLKEYQEDDGFFSITALHKDDIVGLYNFGDDNDCNLKFIEYVTKFMSDSNMEHLASKMADDYCNQLFYDSLRIIFEDRFLNDDQFMEEVMAFYKDDKEFIKLATARAL